MRLRLAGWTAVVTPDAVVRHVGSASAPSAFVLRYATRNRVCAYLRGMPGPILATTLLPAALIWIAGAAVETLRGRGTARLAALREAVDGLGPTLRERRALQGARRVALGGFAGAVGFSLL